MVCELRRGAAGGCAAYLDAAACNDRVCAEGRREILKAAGKLIERTHRRPERAVMTVPSYGSDHNFVGFGRRGDWGGQFQDHRQRRNLLRLSQINGRHAWSKLGKEDTGVQFDRISINPSICHG